MTCAELMLDEDEEDIFMDSALMNAPLLPSFSFYVDNVCEYIAGFVVRRLLSRLRCYPCRLLLLSLSEEFTLAFLQLQDRGGLVKPSWNVVAVVRVAEKQIRMLVATEKPAHSP